MTDAQLKAELSLPAYSGKTASEKTAMLNAAHATAKIARIVPKAEALKLLSAASFRIGSLPEPHKTGWDITLRNIGNLEIGLNFTEPGVATLLSQAVSGGVLTPDEKTAIDTASYRPATVAEALWGEGTVVSLNDVARVS